MTYRPKQPARLASLDAVKGIDAITPADASVGSTSVTLPSPQARPKKKISVTPADSSQLNLL